MRIMSACSFTTTSELRVQRINHYKCGAFTTIFTAHQPLHLRRINHYICSTSTTTKAAHSPLQMRRIYATYIKNRLNLLFLLIQLLYFSGQSCQLHSHLMCRRAIQKGRPASRLRRTSPAATYNTNSSKTN